jgi:D-amino-acid oxidase
MPAAVTRSLADDHPVARLRGGEILPDPDFSLLRASDAYLVGIRPHREGGVCLKLDDELIPSQHGSKFLIHNYGHGGAGITLSFGCASVVADHVATLKREIRRPSIAVIGCGVIGLTVAAELRRRWRNLRITIYAKDLDVRRTTSFVAAGQFEPSGICAEYESEEEKKILADYLRRSRDRIMELHRSSHWHTYGIALRRDYTLDQWNGAYDECTPHDVVPQYRSGNLPFAKLNTIGREYRTWLINPTILLPQLFTELKRSGVRLRKRQFASRDDFASLRENIIINCTGYGAKALMNDEDVVAKRGHLVVLRRTLPKQFYFFSGGCGNRRIMYAFCRHRDIVLGGTVETGNDSDNIMESDRDRFNRILANARAMFDGRPRDCVTA